MSTAQIHNIVGSILDPADTSKMFSVSTTGSSTGVVNTVSFASSVNRTYTFPDATTTMVGTGVNQTLTGKTMDGGSNTFTNINGGSSIIAGTVTNATLANSTINVIAGSGLTGGGTVALGGTVTLTNPTSGTVTSVGLTAPTEFIVSGTPVTSTGTLALSKAVQPANFVWAGPDSGPAAVPTFRALTLTDVVGTSVITRQFVGTANLVQTPPSNTFVTMFPSGVGSLTIPANILSPGTMIFFRIGGTFGSVSSATCTLRMMLGGNVVAASSATSLGTNNNVHMTVDGYFTVRTVGTTGTVVGDCMLFSASSPTNPNLVGTTTTTSTVINTTLPLAIDVQLRYLTAAAANTFTVVNAVIWYGSA